MVGFFMLFNRKFKVHPYPIIASALIFHALGLYAEYSVFKICDYRLPRLFLWSIEPFQMQDFKRWINVAEWLNTYDNWP